MNSNRAVANEYTGYRVALTANYGKMAVPLKLDITTGDVITPKEIEYSYKLMMEDRCIPVLAYNLPTILAEKLETVISRGDLNTRPRDYYDVYILFKLYNGNIDQKILADAFRSTAEKRGSLNVVKHYHQIMNIVKKSPAMKNHWNNYRKDFDYAAEIEFENTCDTVVDIMDKISGGIWT